MAEKTPPKEHPIPPLRQDIKIFRGPDEADGSPTYNLYDPVRAQYFKISWTEATILQHLRGGMTISQLAEEINKTATFQVTPEEVKNFLLEASRLNLLATRRASEDVLKEAEMRKRNPFIWLAFYYLYFRVPLLNPDKFLARTLPYVRPLVSNIALAIYTILALTGLLLLVGRFDDFIHTFTYFFNIQGFVAYAVAIIVVKIIHEFSHAYTAKYYGLHIPTMGVAFIVLWPVLYTDVTDGWKLSKRSERIAISFAGIAAELILAGISTLGWALTEPGLLHSVFFVVASVTWVSTLAINLNPALRYDGYYILCDLTGIDNLQLRSFAFTRWQFRKWLLGLDVPPPEELITPKRKWGLIIYAWYTWIYRIFLYTAIAVLVYFKFTKVLGIILFAVEIAIFLIAPFVSEIRQLKRQYPYLKINPRLITTLTILSLIAVWFVIPLPHQQSFAAITTPKKDQVIYVPEDGIIKKINVKLGDKVSAGQTLIELSSPLLELSISEKEAEAAIIQAQLNVLSLSETERSFYPEKEAELSGVKAKLQGLLYQKEQLIVKAALDGTIYEWDDDLKEGLTLSKNQIIGKLAPLKTFDVMAFVPQTSINDLTKGEDVTFRTGNFDDYAGKVTDIRQESAPVLLYPQLASINKGPLPVVEEPQKGGTPQLALVESFFPVIVSLDENQEGPPLKIGVTGQVIHEGPWKSLLMSLIDRIRAVFWRESGI